MKTLATRILVGISLIALFIVGVDWVLETTEVTIWVFGSQGAWRGVRSLEIGWMSVGAGIAFMVLPILTTAAWLLAGRDQHIEAKVTNGKIIRLRPETVERVMQKHLRQRIGGDLRRVSSEARQAGPNRCSVRLNVVLSEGLDVPATVDTIEQQAVRILKEVFKFADASLIKVVVYDLVASEKGGRSKRRPKSRGDSTRNLPERKKPRRPNKPAKKEEA